MLKTGFSKCFPLFSGHQTNICPEHHAHLLKLSKTRRMSSFWTLQLSEFLRYVRKSKDGQIPKFCKAGQALILVKNSKNIVKTSENLGKLHLWSEVGF